MKWQNWSKSLWLIKKAQWRVRNLQIFLYWCISSYSADLILFSHIAQAFWTVQEGNKETSDETKGRNWAWPWRVHPQRFPKGKKTQFTVFNLFTSSLWHLLHTVKQTTACPPVSPASCGPLSDGCESSSLHVSSLLLIWPSHTVVLLTDKIHYPKASGLCWFGGL